VWSLEGRDGRHRPDPRMDKGPLMKSNEQPLSRPDGEKDRSEEPGLHAIAKDTIRSPFFSLQPSQLPSGPEESAFCRRHPRFPVQIRVEISLVRPDGTSYDRGTGVVRDLSRSGLLLTEVTLGQGSFLASSFGIRLRPEGESPCGPEIAGRIRRASTSGNSAFGIEFLAPQSGTEERLRQGR
jgi:hypothetical protein